MSLTLLLYLIDAISKFALTLAIVLVVTLMAIGLTALAWIVGDLPKAFEASAKKLFKWGGIFALCSIIVLNLLPSKNTMYLMAAAYAGEQLVRSDDFQEAHGKLRLILNDKLDEIARESLAPNKK